MKPLFSLLAALLLLASCGPAKDKVRLKGEFRHLDNAEFYVYAATGTEGGIDTVRIEGGKFSHDIALNEPQVLTLLYPNHLRTIVIAEPGTTVKIVSDAENLDHTDVGGTEENERFTKFRLRMLERPAADRHLAAAQYVRDNARSLDGFAAYLQYFAEDRTVRAKESLQLLEELSHKQPRNAAVQHLAERMRPLLSNGVGMPLAAFSGTTLDGQAVSRARFADRPLLLVYFASWQSDSRQALRSVKRISRAFPSLQVLYVSLDTAPQRCREYVKADTLSLNRVVCDGKAFHSPIVQTLGAHRVPGNILVNAAGQVVARDVPNKDLENEVAKIMKD